ncbi:MAG TPA: hypothetical protein VMW17_03505 [Candidatus Binatia bacterium]|nr:hypothetical protein [Candidatus Binatia bacterium]
MIAHATKAGAVVLAFLATTTAVRADAAADHVAAQCVGDCDSSGRVTVEELVTGVSIALGNLLLDQCPEFDVDGDKHVLVNELVRAVDDALYGCGVAPPTQPPTSTRTNTPTPTATPSTTSTPSMTPTPTSTPTPSPTPGPPNVAGQWREDQYAVSSSTCPAVITNLISSELSQLQPCVYTLTQSGGNVHAVDCGGTVADGTVDDLGVIHFSLPQMSDTEQGCTVVEKPDVFIDTRDSPAMAQTMLAFTVSGNCTFVGQCSVVVGSRWTKL